MNSDHRQKAACDQTRYLGVKEAAAYLSVPENTLRSWLRKRRIPFIKAEGRVLLDREAIEKWLLERAVPSEDGRGTSS